VKNDAGGVCRLGLMVRVKAGHEKIPKLAQVNKSLLEREVDDEGNPTPNAAVVARKVDVANQSGEVPGHETGVGRAAADEKPLHLANEACQLLANNQQVR
jgi:hypothetical protein